MGAAQGQPWATREGEDAWTGRALSLSCKCRRCSSISLTLRCWTCLVSLGKGAARRKPCGVHSTTDPTVGTCPRRHVPSGCQARNPRSRAREQFSTVLSGSRLEEAPRSIWLKRNSLLPGLSSPQILLASRSILAQSVIPQLHNCPRPKSRICP